MKLEDLNISSHTGIDPCGRVFFYEGRVLRAINPDAEEWVREFLSSELYSKLAKNGWFVKTWIIDDVQLDGYPLIVESERVYACQWQLLTFEQLRDIGILAVKINALCNQYGWVLVDVFFTNFGLRDGQICYFDLGGFSHKGERPELVQFFARWKNLRLISFGNGTLAKYAKEGFEIGYNDAMLPAIRTELDDYLDLHVFHAQGMKYNVYRKRTKPAIFSIRTRLAHLVINGINRLAERLSKKPYPWRLLYVEPAHKLTEQDFERLTPYYQGYTNVKYLSNDIIKYFMNQNDNSKNQLKSLMLYGEYRIEDIELLRNSYNGQIWVCSPLQPYTDSIYREIKKHKINVGVLSYNFSYDTLHDNEKIIELGIDGLLCHNRSLSKNVIVKDPSYVLRKMVKYFNQVYMEYEGTFYVYIKDNKILKKYN